MHQNPFSTGAPRWGSLRRSPRPSSRLGRGKAPPHSSPPSTPMVSRSWRPEFHFPKVGNPSADVTIPSELLPQCNLAALSVCKVLELYLRMIRWHVWFPQQFIQAALIRLLCISSWKILLRNDFSSFNLLHSFQYRIWNSLSWCEFLFLGPKMDQFCSLFSYF